MTKNNQIQKMQEFLWDGFWDSESVGVNLDDLLTWPRLKLTSEQVNSVVARYHDIDGVDKWDSNNEYVKNIIATATDCDNFDWLYCWLIWTVGDQTAADLVESWRED